MCKRNRPKYQVGDVLEYWSQNPKSGVHKTQHFMVVGIEWWGRNNRYYDYLLKALSSPPGPVETHDRDDIELVDWLWWQRKCRSGYRKVG